MRCSNCQIENKDAAKFCRGCGHTLAVAEMGQQVPMKICSQCQHECKPEAKFCLKCGCKFAPAAIAPETETVELVAQQSAEIKAEDHAFEAGKPCPVCSNTLKLKAKFCGKCGFSFADEARQDATESADLPTAAMVGKPVGVAAPVSVPVGIAAPLGVSVPVAVVAQVETAIPVAVAVPVTAPAAERPFCPSCRGTVREDARFCGNCGFTFSAGLQTKPADKTSPAQKSVPDRPAPRAEAEIRPPVGQGGAVHEMKNGGKAVLTGALLASIVAVAGGSYWWLKVRNADAVGTPTAQTPMEAKAVPASAIPPTTTVASAPVPAPAVEEKMEAVPRAEVAARNEVAPVLRQNDTVKDTKKEKSPVSVKKDSSEKSKHPGAVAVTESPPAPMPSAPHAVVQDVAIDAQSETMLSMADRMYASKSYTSVLDLARPVLKKYPGNAHASRLVNNSRAALDMQQAELLGKLKDLAK